MVKILRHERSIPGKLYSNLSQVDRCSSNPAALKTDGAVLLTVVFPQ